MSKVSRNKSLKITQILDSFAELVRQKGYMSTQIRDIAETAGVSVGLIYKYFPKGIPEIASKLYERHIESIDPLKLKDPACVEDEIRRHINYHRDNQNLYRAFDLAALGDKDLFAGSKRKRVEVLVSQYGDQESALKATQMYGIVDAIVHRHLFVESLAESDEALVSKLVKIVSASQ